MAWAQWLTLAIAVIGAGLGIFNTIVAYRRGTPRIKIVEVYQSLNNPDRLPFRYAIRVENRGSVPVAVLDVVIIAQGEKKTEVPFIDWQIERGPVIEPHRSRTLELAARELSSDLQGGKAWIEAKTEASGVFRRRARHFASFIREQQALVQSLAVGTTKTKFPS